MFSSDREQLRKKFFETWSRYQQQLPLEALQAELLAVILLHPEYHEMLNHPEDFQSQDFAEANPFLHMSLHLAIREQSSTDRPAGIKKIHAQLCEKYSDLHMAEHKMMDCLGEILWQAQRDRKMPDEEMYLEALRKL